MKRSRGSFLRVKWYWVRNSEALLGRMELRQLKSERLRGKRFTFEEGKAFIWEAFSFLSCQIYISISFGELMILRILSRDALLMEKRLVIARTF